MFDALEPSQRIVIVVTLHREFAQVHRRHPRIEATGIGFDRVSEILSRLVDVMRAQRELPGPAPAIRALPGLERPVARRDPLEFLRGAGRILRLKTGHGAIPRRLRHIDRVQLRENHQRQCEKRSLQFDAERTIRTATMPKRDRYVFVCTNRRADDNPKGSCAQKGSEALLASLKGAVAQAGLHTRVRVLASGCLDVCWMGNTVAVMPDMTFFGNVTETDIPALVEAFKSPTNVGDAEALRARVIQPDQFEDTTKPVKLGRKPSP